MRRPPRLRARAKPPLTIQQILAWADEFHAHHGRWPNNKGGVVPGDLTMT